MAKGTNTAFHPNRQVSREALPASGGGSGPDPTDPATRTNNNQTTYATGQPVMQMGGPSTNPSAIRGSSPQVMGGGGASHQAPPNWDAVNANRQNLQDAISHGAVSSGLGFVPKANDANTLMGMAQQSAINSRRTPTSSGDSRGAFVGGLAGTGGATATSPRPVSQGGMAGWGGAAAGNASGLGGGKGGKNGMFGAGLSPGAGNGTSASAMRPALAPATPAAAPAAVRPAPAASTGGAMSTQFTPYTVQSGDTLWDIAERTTGSGSNWQQIYDANESVIGGDPNLIMPGQQLRLSSGQSLPQTR